MRNEEHDPSRIEASVALQGGAAVRGRTLQGFHDLVLSLKGDPGVLLRESGIDAAALDDQHGFIAFPAMRQLMERAALELNCPDFGLRLAALQAAQGATRILGPLDVAMRNSPTLGDAFRYCAEHMSACSTAIRITLEELPRERRVLMQFEQLASAEAAMPQSIEHGLAATQYATRALSGGRANAREVWFTHEPIAPMAVYRASFNATVRFNQSVTGLFFNAQDLALPVPEADPQLYEIATSYIDDRFPAATSSLGSRVRAMISRLLIEGDCSPERVASALGLHLRTLQRRLREEGLSFEAIKDGVRRDVALRYLQQPDIPLVKVTEILGYSETSVLSRSCHRWFAASPRQLRNELTR